MGTSGQATENTLYESLSILEDINTDLPYIATEKITNLAAKGAGYWFDGVNDVITVPHDSNLDIMGDGKPYSILVGFNSKTLLSRAGLISKRVGGTEYWQLTSVDGTQIQFFKTASGVTDSGSIPCSLDINHIVGVTNDGGTSGGDDATLKMFLDGSLKLTDNAFKTGSCNSTENLTIGREIANTDTWDGAIRMAYLFNMDITDDEMKAFSNGAPLPYKYVGANQTALTSGTLTIGKQYIIDTFVAGDNFTNVGGTNVTGNSFVATGTTPSTWTNSSSLRHTGCVLQLEQDGITESIWFDKSGNKLNGTVSGALPTNISKTVQTEWKRISVSEMGLPSTNPPAKAQYGIAAALEFTLNTDHAEYKTQVPGNYVSGTDALVHAHWTKSTTGTDQSAKFVKWQLKYLVITEGDNINSGESTLTVEDEYTSAVTASQIEHVTGSVTIPGSGLTAHDTIYMQLSAVTPTGTALSDEPAVLAVDYEFETYAEVQ